MPGSFPRPYIEDIVRGHPDVVAVVGVYDDDIVALASLQRDSRSTAELAILVEDAWQGDLGWRLAVALLGAPLVGCLANVKASILAGNSAALGSVRKAMRTTGVTATTRRDRETICVTMALSADDIPHSPTAANWQ